MPLYAAGFVTAFGAHSIAASLGGYTHGQHASLLTLGLLLAIYDGAEVALKPVFGSLADRIGARPVLLGGLLASSPVIPPGWVWPGSGRARPRRRSPRPPGCWCRG
jgi:MFS family permease